MIAMIKEKYVLASVLFLLAFMFAATPVEAKKPSEYDSIVRHLKTKYRAKKVNIPFLWLARFAVSVVRPAGVKSFSVTLFEDLKFSRETLDKEMQEALSQSFSREWSPVFRIRSREGQQAYMYMRESGQNIRLTLVTIDKQQAAIIRATFSPEKLAEFTNDPKIFGMSLSEKKKPEEVQAKPSETGESAQAGSAKTPLLD
jgi:hypothetical protein